MTAFPLVFITIGMAPVPGVVEIVSDYLEEPVLGKTCAKRDCKNFCNSNGAGSECTNGEAGAGCHDNSECDASKGYVCNTYKKNECTRKEDCKEGCKCNLNEECATGYFCYTGVGALQVNGCQAWYNEGDSCTTTVNGAVCTRPWCKDKECGPGLYCNTVGNCVIDYDCHRADIADDPEIQNCTPTQAP